MILSESHLTILSPRRVRATWKPNSRECLMKLKMTKIKSIWWISSQSCSLNQNLRKLSLPKEYSRRNRTKQSLMKKHIIKANNWMSKWNWIRLIAVPKIAISNSLSRQRETLSKVHLSGMDHQQRGWHQLRKCNFSIDRSQGKICLLQDPGRLQEKILISQTHQKVQTRMPIKATRQKSARIPKGFQSPKRQKEGASIQ